MSEETWGNFYDKSPSVSGDTGQGSGDFYKNPQRDTSITVDSETGQATYASMAAEGMEPVKVPPPPGWTLTESVLLKDLPHHVMRQCESVLERSGKAHEVFGHYAGVARGSGVVDDATAGQIEKLSDGLARASDQRAYFKENIRPFLQSMKPARRPKE